MAKKCSLMIYRVSGGWDASVLSLCLSSSRRKTFQNPIFSELNDTLNYVNYSNYRYKYFDFFRQSNKTDIIVKHLFAKVFAKTPISALP